MTLALMILHVCLISIDEHYFNKKRFHSKYEIWSILTDGVLFLIPILFATFVPFDEKWIILYKVLAGLSMVSIIKNELKKDFHLFFAQSGEGIKSVDFFHSSTVFETIEIA